MLSTLLTWSVRRYVRAPGRSWLFTTGALLLMRSLSAATQRREVIDVSRTKPGDRIIIEHLGITHKEQMKELKKARKRSRSEERAEVKAAKAEAKAAKAEAKAARAEALAARRYD